MTLRTRLVATLALIAIVLALPAVYALTRLDAVTDIARNQQQRHGVAFRAVGAIQTLLTELDSRQVAQLVQPDVSTQSRVRETQARMRIQADTLASAGYTVEADLVEARVDSLARLSTYLDSLNASEPVTEEVYDAVYAPMLSATTASLDSMAERMVDASGAELKAATEIATDARGSLLLALAAALVTAVLLAVVTTRLVSGPIRRLRGAMAQVADGNFLIPPGLPYDRNDEVGDVSRSFRSMTEQLADLERLKAEFMSIATHELKTPINVIAGYAELMEDRIFGDLSEKQEEALLSISEQTRVLTQLVNQLLDMSRLEAGGLNLELDAVVLEDLVERIRRTFSVLADRKRIGFSASVDPSAPDRLQGDADRLRDQVLGNLLSNALKFTPEGGEIAVTVGGAKGEVVIVVTDSGPGIPADKLPHIFDKYYQVGGEGRSKGAGLGLTIAHDVVEAHGGTIAAESEEGVGTTFTIRLPVDGAGPLPRRRHASPAAAEGLAAAARGEGGRKAGGG